MKKIILICVIFLVMLTFLVSCKNTTEKNNTCETNEDCAALSANFSDSPGPNPKFVCEKNSCIRNLD
jgi:uncharacterized alpha/beta hydrolase family protein